AVILNRRSLARLAVVDERLREIGPFTEARAELQRLVVEALPPALSAEDALVVDFRLQIDQARSLGARLPEDVRKGLDELARDLRRPIVARSDLAAAAALLEEIAGAESALHTRIFDDAREDARAELFTALVGLGVLGILAAAGLWAVPEAVVEPLRRRLRESTRALLEQERELARAQQLARLGEAAGTLAHEVRNPLAGVVMALQNLSREQEALAPRIAPLLGELERVTRTLRQYLGRIHVRPEPSVGLDAARVVRDLAELLSYQAPPPVHIRNRVPGPFPVRAGPDALRQVLLNLGLNAIEAMEEAGGTLTFEGRREGNSAVLSVLDDGPGFPEKVLSDRAEAFVSEKEEGTGVGLRVVRRLVTGMGGEARFCNRPDGGARVDLIFPVEEASP
ncbi:MAG TPA: HAMP domain-containing sensor histidine kinase, partial [Longimicrobiales bacterium]|nr:HAMP domain-containing sensor histidine kinase [Longimicrobiales bacterium]